MDLCLHLRSFTLKLIAVASGTACLNFDVIENIYIYIYMKEELNGYFEF